MDFEGALIHAEAALVLARQLGARRFEPEALAFRAELYRLAGQLEQALVSAEEAVMITRETGTAFLGAFALGAFALANVDPTKRRAALKEGEALLEAGAVSHNHLLFGRDAIEAYLGLGDWDGVERSAAALARYTQSEPVPFADFYIARGRALAACGRGQSDAPALAEELEDLRAEGERLGLRVALAEIDKAIVRFCVSRLI
jgi:hypothetical protein